MAKKNRSVEEIAYTAVIDEAIETTEQPDGKEFRAGIVANCKMLNVRKGPSAKADIISIIRNGAVVEINNDASTEDFYKVVTDDNIAGFCMKKFIEIL